MRVPVVVVAVAVALLAPACGSEGATSTTSLPTTATAPTTTPATTTTTTAPAPPEPAWDVGATPLPLRADGFGQVLPTPPALVNRDLPTTDHLPPPSGGFESEIRALDPPIVERMGTSWQPGCPVPLADLRYLTVSFWGFDERPHTGEIIVHHTVAEDIVTVFGRLFEARFPIEAMRIVTTADVDALPTGDGNGTGAFVCRPVRGGTRLSAHAYGLAIDINPFINPYQRDDLVLPELASAYLDRANQRPGMIYPGDVVTAAFAEIGWTWGGTWSRPLDLMHFSATGH